jgi:tetratricopeptide (TPR) repeat protein
MSRQSYAQAEQALAAGDLPAAKAGYTSALVNARLAGDLPPGAEAALAEKLARVLGNLCERADAEKTFLEAVSAAEKSSGARPARTFPLRIELAQFAFDTDQFEKATRYFESAFAVGETLMAEKQPVAMAQLVDDYAVALEKSGQAAEAEKARRKANSLREKGGESSVVKGKSDYVPYPKTCP